MDTSNATGAVETSSPTPDNTAAYLDSLAQEAAAAALPVEMDESGQPRDASGRFVSVKTEDADAPETDEATEGTEEEEVVAEGEAATDGEATTEGEESTEEAATPEVPAIPKLGRDPIIPFAVKVGEADFEGVPDLNVTFKGPGGKERTEPLDKLVRLASDGIYQESREQRYRDIEAERNATKAELESAKAYVEQQRAYLEAVMSDEGRYLAEKDRWDRQHTPEAQAERYRQQLAEMQEREQLSAIAREGERYFTETLTPALDTIAEALPFVSAEELVAKVKLQVDALQGRRGYLTPDQYQAVSAFVLDDLAPWAQQVNASRKERYGGSDTKAVAAPAKGDEAAKAKAEAEKARVEAAKAKQAVAKAVKPVGKAAPNTAQKKARPAPVNTDEALDWAVEDAVNAALGH